LFSAGFLSYCKDPTLLLFIDFELPDCVWIIVERSR
jgi:hypothetical protein